MIFDSLFVQTTPDTHVITGYVDCYPMRHVLGRPELVDARLLADPAKNEDAITEAQQKLMILGASSSDLVLRPVLSNPYLHATFHPRVEPGFFLRPGDKVVARVVSSRSLRYVAQPPWLLEGNSVPSPVSKQAMQGLSQVEEDYQIGVVVDVLAVNDIPTSKHQSAVIHGATIPGEKIWNDKRELWPFQGGSDPSEPLPARGYYHWLMWLLGIPIGLGDKFLVAGPTGSGKSFFERLLALGLAEMIDTVMAMVGEHEQDIPLMEEALAGRGYFELFSAPVQLAAERKLRIYELADLRAKRLAERNWRVSLRTGQQPVPVVIFGDSITSGIQDTLNRKKVEEGRGMLSGGRNPLVPFAAMTIASSGRLLARNGVSLTNVGVVLLRGPEDLATYKELRGATRAAMTLDPDQVAAQNYPGFTADLTKWTLEGRNTVTLPSMYTRSADHYLKPDHLGFARELRNWLNVEDTAEKVERLKKFLAAAKEAYVPRLIGEMNVDPMPDSMRAVYDKVGVRRLMVVGADTEVVDDAFLNRVAEVVRYLFDGQYPKQGFTEKIATLEVDGKKVSRAVARRIAQRLRNEGSGDRSARIPAPEDPDTRKPAVRRKRTRLRTVA